MFSFRPARRARFTKSFATVFKKCCLLFPIQSAEKTTLRRELISSLFPDVWNSSAELRRILKISWQKFSGNGILCLLWKLNKLRRNFSGLQMSTERLSIVLPLIENLFLRRRWLLKLQGTRWFISPIFTFRRFNENCFSHFSSDCKQSEKFN